MVAIGAREALTSNFLENDIMTLPLTPDTTPPLCTVILNRDGSAELPNRGLSFLHSARNLRLPLGPEKEEPFRPTRHLKARERCDLYPDLCS